MANGDEIKCEKCGNEIFAGDNFCTHCGAKVVDTCDCWVKKELYNCGQERCPGYRFYLTEKQKL